MWGKQNMLRRIVQSFRLEKTSKINKSRAGTHPIAQGAQKAHSFCHTNVSCTSRQCVFQPPLTAFCSSASLDQVVKSHETGEGWQRRKLWGGATSSNVFSGRASANMGTLRGKVSGFVPSPGKRK